MTPFEAKIIYLVIPAVITFAIRYWRMAARIVVNEHNKCLYDVSCTVECKRRITLKEKESRAINRVIKDSHKQSVEAEETYVKLDSQRSLERPSSLRGGWRDVVPARVFPRLNAIKGAVVRLDDGQSLEHVDPNDPSGDWDEEDGRNG